MTGFANIGGPLDSVLLRWNSGRESVIIEALVLVASLSIVLCVEDTKLMVYRHNFETIRAIFARGALNSGPNQRCRHFRNDAIANCSESLSPPPLFCHRSCERDKKVTRSNQHHNVQCR